MTADSTAVEIRRGLAENDEDLVKVLARRERLLRAAAAAGLSGEPAEDAEEHIAGARNLALVHGLDPRVAEQVWHSMLAGFADIYRGEFAGS